MAEEDASLAKLIMEEEESKGRTDREEREEYQEAFFEEVFGSRYEEDPDAEAMDRRQEIDWTKSWVGAEIGAKQIFYFLSACTLLAVATYGAFLLDLVLGSVMAGILFSAIIFSVNSVKKVPADERALAFRFGKIVGQPNVTADNFADARGKVLGVKGGGWYFVPWLPGFYLWRVTREFYNFDYSQVEVVTIAAEERYRAVTEGGSGQELPSSERYGRQSIKVDCAAYIRCPETYGRLRLFYESNAPKDKDGLKAITDDMLFHRLRMIMALMTWPEAIKNIADIMNIVIPDPNTKTNLSIPGLQDEADKDQFDILESMGFDLIKDFRFVLNEIHIPDDIKKELAVLEQKRISANGAQHTKRQRVEETTGVLLESFAMAINQNTEEAKQNLAELIKQNDQVWKDLVDILVRRMALDGGAYYDHRFKYEGEPGLLPPVALLQDGSKKGGRQIPPSEENVIWEDFGLAGEHNWKRRPT